MKINLSKIFRYILIILINILFVFALQYYINLQAKISSSLSDLQIAIFFDNSNLDSDNDNEENVISKISSNNKLKNIEIVNSTDLDKFSEINSELDNVIPKESINFPNFILANIVNINNINDLENLKKEILNIEEVEDFVYDQKAYKMFFDNRILLNRYKKVFKIVFYLIIVIFFLKFLFYILKTLYKDILFEMSCGILLGLCAYAIICLITIFNQNNIFMLSGQVLYILIPLSSMVTLVTKESNV